MAAVARLGEDAHMRKRILGCVVAVGFVAACSSTKTAGTTTTTAAATSTTVASTTSATNVVPTSSTTIAEGDKVQAGPDGDAFYTPSPMPAGKPGDLIWMSPLVGSPVGAFGFKVLYHSQSIADKDIPVSGLLWVPKDVRPDAPIISYAHGTTGLGDVCAPSKTEGKGEADTVAQEFLAKGFIVVATDYEGSGTPGVHPYVVGISEGRGVLDAIRAARTYTGTTGKSVVWGHSQGGGAALFAAELAPTYAPDAGVVGSVAGAPAVELKLLAAALRTSPFFGYIFQAAAGFHAAYPDVDLSQVLTAKGLEAEKLAETTCGEVHDLVRGKHADDYLKVDPATSEPWATYLEKNTPGNVSTTVPIFVYHGENDEQIPVIGSQLYFNRECKTGGTAVLRKTYPGETHVSVILKAKDDIESFIADRLASKSFVPTPCPAA